MEYPEYDDAVTAEQWDNAELPTPEWMDIMMCDGAQTKGSFVEFELVDVDGDGIITYHEFSSLINVYAEASTMLEFDRDGDGKLNPTEFSANPDAPAFFKVDLDEDFFVTELEIVTFVLWFDDYYSAPVLESDNCEQPPSECAGSSSRFTLGECQNLVQRSYSGLNTCERRALWEGGSVKAYAYPPIELLEFFIDVPFLRNEEEKQAFVQAASVSLHDLTLKAPHLVHTFDAIDISSDGVLQPDELYSYLLAGADMDALWFIFLFDRDCNGLLQAEETRAFCMHNLDPCDDVFNTYAFFKSTADPDSPTYCPYAAADALNPAALLTPEALRPYLQAMRAISRKDAGRDGTVRMRVAPRFGQLGSDTPVDTVQGQTTDTEYRNNKTAPSDAETGGRRKVRTVSEWQHALPWLRMYDHDLDQDSQIADSSHVARQENRNRLRDFVARKRETLSESRTGWRQHIRGRTGGSSWRRAELKGDTHFHGYRRRTDSNSTGRGAAGGSGSAGGSSSADNHDDPCIASYYEMYGVELDPDGCSPCNPFACLDEPEREFCTSKCSCQAYASQAGSFSEASGTGGYGPLSYCWWVIAPDNQVGRIQLTVTLTTASHIVFVYECETANCSSPSFLMTPTLELPYSETSQRYKVDAQAGKALMVTVATSPWYQTEQGFAVTWSVEDFWEITTEQRKASQLLQEIIPGLNASASIGPHSLFALTQGFSNQAPEGWSGLALLLYDEDGSFGLSREEARSLLWMTDAVYSILVDPPVPSSGSRRASSELQTIDYHNGFLLWKREKLIFPSADMDGDGVLSEGEWSAAFGNDRSAPSFSKLASSGEVTLETFLRETYGTEVLAYPLCVEDNPCRDCLTWDAGNGLCATYAPGGKNSGYCDEDSDKYGVLARDACPLACSGDDQLICAPNIQSLMMFDVHGASRAAFPTEVAQPLAAVVMRLPRKALRTETAIGMIRSKFDNPWRGRGPGQRMLTLDALRKLDPDYAQNVLNAPPLPEQAGHNGGLDGSVLSIDVKGNHDLIDGKIATLEFGIDPCTIRSASGCTVINLGSLRICAAGRVGVYGWEDGEGTWREVPSEKGLLPPNGTGTATAHVCSCPEYAARLEQRGAAASRTCSRVESLRVEASTLPSWAMVLTSPVCCVYNGTAKSCTAQTCLGADMAADGTTHGYLGQGSVTKMPRLKTSDRPLYAQGPRPRTWAQMNALHAMSLNRSKEEFVPRTGWIQMCVGGLVAARRCASVGQANRKIPGANWFLPRFGHAAAKVDGNRVLLYGGFGCERANASSGGCATLQAFGDLWEVVLGDVGSALASRQALIVRELSPRLPGMGGSVAVAIPGESHRLFVVGGASVSLPSLLLGGQTRPQTQEPFSVRNLQVRDRQVDALQSSVLPSVSGHSATVNASGAVIFGGFVENTLTSGAFTYQLDRATADGAIRAIRIEGDAPSARAFASLILMDSNDLLVFGGMQSAVNDSGVGIKRVALGDLWTHNFVNGHWKEHQEVGKSPVNPSVFHGVSVMTNSHGERIVLVQGGVTIEFKPGVSTALRVSRSDPNPFPYGPGQRSPSAEFKALLPEEWVEGSNFSRWIRIRPRQQPVSCISAQPLCNDGGTTDEYWRCMPAPHPWWTRVRETLSPCTWAPPSTSCERVVDPQTHSCTLAQPPVMQCEPAPRFSHSLTSGRLLGGKEAAVVYGGFSSSGELLHDMWLYPLHESFPKSRACENCGWLFRMEIYTQLPSLVCNEASVAQFKDMLVEILSAPNRDDVHFEVLNSSSSALQYGRPICDYSCTEDGTKWSGDARSFGTQAGDRAAKEDWIVVQVSTTNWEGIYDFLDSKCNGGCKEYFSSVRDKHVTCTGGSERRGSRCALAAATLMRLLTPDSADLERCYRGVRAAGGGREGFQRACLRYREARVQAVQLDPEPECTESCMRGYCQFDEPQRYWELRAPLQCDSFEPCGGDGVCSLPGPRSGHSAISFLFQEVQPTILIFGGQTAAGLGSPSSGWQSSLLNDVVTGLFEGSSIAFARHKIRCSDASPCPEPRRDAATTLIDNRDGSSGKLILFGGLAHGDAEAWLDNDFRGMMVLDDTWVLDLDQINADGLGMDCLLVGRCITEMRWTKLLIEGERPLSRFGLGLTALDVNGEGLLYLHGGEIVDAQKTTVAATKEIDDLYAFRLHDPFFRRCSATGTGLAKATAGEMTSFFLACTDILGTPAPNALFSVSILAGGSCTGCPSVFPPVIAIGVGLYKCSYLPVVAGEYRIMITVGRGGEGYQDPVGGDPNSQVSLDVDEIERQVALNPDAVLHGFELSVAAAEMSHPDSIAAGTALTLSTAGVTQQFTIRAVDVFANRRPGGEDISVLIEREGSTGFPDSGSVIDNNDGTYVVRYSLTVSGEYQVAIAIKGFNGAGGPFALRVQAQPAFPSLTYAYGQLLSGKTGFSYSVFVQTRDKYGNFISADPEEFPDGQDTIRFEPCSSTGSPGSARECEGDPECPPCLGQPQSINKDVAISIVYAAGPEAKRVYPGLYKITYLPLTPGAFVPLIRHNGLYISCYFDSGSAPLDALADPADAANQCIFNRTVAALDELSQGAAVRRAAAVLEAVEPACLADTERRRSDGGGLSAAFDPARDNVVTEIQRTFVTPDVEAQRRWVWLLPLLSAVTGVVLMCGQWCVDLRRERIRDDDQKLFRTASETQIKQELANTPLIRRAGNAFRVIRNRRGSQVSLEPPVGYAGLKKSISLHSDLWADTSQVDEDVACSRELQVPQPENPDQTHNLHATEGERIVASSLEDTAYSHVNSNLVFQAPSLSSAAQQSAAVLPWTEGNGSESQPDPAAGVGHA